MIILLLIGLCYHQRDIPEEDIHKLDSSTAASEFYEKVQVGTNVYIPHCNYQVKPHLSPWFLAACAAVIVPGNHFFRLNQQNKSLSLNRSSGRLVIAAKTFLKLANFFM